MVSGRHLGYRELLHIASTDSIARNGTGIGSDPADLEGAAMTEGAEAGAGLIVVGVDGSRPSRQALRWGAHLATTFGAGLDAVTAWDFPAGYGLGLVVPNWDPAQANVAEHASCPVLVIHGDQDPPV
jgi:Universal stress protein family